ncbi:O-antigen/teichoic acid export membrane protein [Pararhizobium capsulatum DSM 1112]|uniref:O-antigen/teichoic acid export membrane protein n=1 Tax=Pararhizobium capsulatum DSM 1112 TaxID=1121113 RepID=A0ABU0BN45_9HYPH|nr:polysaccharide biosynthesis C-terminal domain-containing protein [Pararhizobium capsulatum]MDQ0319677.1 O-antigen/teichoic acid export membrane protein [Pararhizobium capsulatum DSM 1112]
MLLRQTQLYLPAQIGAPLVQLASVVVWAHILPPGELGKLVLVIALQDILFALLFVWWSHFMLRFLPGIALAGESESFRKTEIAVVTSATLLQFVIVTIIGFLYFPGVSLLFHVAVGIFVSLRALGTYCGERARAEERILCYTLMQAVLPAIGLGLSVVLSGIAGGRAEVVLLAVAAPLVAAPWIVSVRPDFTGIGRFDRDILRQAFAFGLPAMLAATLAAAALNMPRFLVDQSLGHAAAGTFSVAFGLGIRVSTFAVMLVTAGAYPLAVRRTETEGVQAGMQQLSTNMVLVWAVATRMAFGLVGISGSVVPLVLPEAMQAAARTILPLAAIAGLFRYLRAHTTDQVFLIASKPRPIAIIAALELVLTALFTALGVLRFGLVGAAIGPLVATGISATVSATWAMRGCEFRFPFAAIGRIALAAIAMLAILLSMEGAVSFAGLALHIAIGMTSYLLAIALLFPQLMLSAIRQGWPKGAGRLGADGRS